MKTKQYKIFSNSFRNHRINQTQGNESIFQKQTSHFPKIYVYTCVCAHARRVFCLNIAKFKVTWCYRYCFKLFSNLRKEKELRQYHCRNSPKVGERKIKSRREKFFIFGNSIAAIPSAQSAARVHARKTKWHGKKKIGNCGNAIAEIGGINFLQLWQQHCQKWGKKKKVTKSVKE